MKKVYIIVLAFISAFIINEVFVKYIISFPTYGLDKKVSGIKSSQGGWQNLRLPNSKYWNVEGGNLVETYNNWGLPGKDIFLTDSSKIIFLLGDSFVECLQMKKKEMASYLFQDMLDSAKIQYTVINLACSGHDPYDLYLRLKYFSHFAIPNYIMLVLQDDKTGWLKRHKNVDFSFYFNNIKENTSLLYLLQKNFRNKFSSLNLFIQGIQNYDNNLDIEGDINNIILQNDNKSISDCGLLDKVLLQYNQMFNEKFLLLSISTDYDLNSNLFNLSKKNNITYFQKNISTSENRINISGHLNKLGNIRLAEFLFSSFKTVIMK